MTLGSLARRLRPRAQTLAAASLLTAATAAVPGLAVALLSRVLDAFLHGDVAGVSQGALAFTALYAAHALAVVARTGLTKSVAWRLAADLRAELHAHWLRGPVGGSVGDRAAALSEEVDQVQLGVSALVTALRNPLTLLGLAVAAAAIAPRLVLPALVLLVPAQVAAWIGGRAVRDAVTGARTARAGLLSLASDQLSGLETIQAFDAVPAEVSRFGARSDADRSARWRLDVIRTLPSLCVQVLLAAALGGLLWFGAQQVAAGELAAGDLVAFLVALGLAQRPLVGLAEVWVLLQRCTAALDRVDTVLAAVRPVDRSPSASLPPGPLALCWEGVSVSRGGRRVLHGVDLVAHPDEILALVGPTGAGKSTLLATVQGGVQLDQGRVSLGGVDLADVASGGGAVSVVPQDLVLFHRSVLDNVALGDPIPNPLRAEEALRQAHAEFALARGLQARVDEAGRNWSGGERQRLCLARALYRGGRVLLLDEPTSQVDPGTAAQLAAVLQALRPGRTIVVVAHDPVLAQCADRVARLVDGRLLETEWTASSPR